MCLVYSNIFWFNCDRSNSVYKGIILLNLFLEPTSTWQRGQRFWSTRQSTYYESDTTLLYLSKHFNSILCILPVAFTQSFLYSSTNSIFLFSRWGHYLWVGCLWTPSPGSFIYYSGLTRYVLNTSPFFSLPKFNKKDKNSSSLFQEENFLIGFVTYVLSQNLF